MAHIGRWNTLTAREFAPENRGLLLDGGPHGLILAPARYLPEDAEPGEEFRVFVYPDSEDRLIATTEEPYAQAGEFACLEVVEVHPKMGAFLDLGLAKDLLLPFREQRYRVRPGQKVVVAVVLDETSQRLIASTRLHRHLDRSPPLYDAGQPVSLLIAEETPLGFSAIINQRHLGLFHHSQLPQPLQIGQTIDGFIQMVRPDGKIDLTLDARGYQRIDPLAERILEALRTSGGSLPLGDRSSPEEIREAFGVSKKAFKQALGTLYKERRIELEDASIRLLA